MTAPGLFLVLDGPDGAGMTQAARLAERLRASGRDVLELREPGGTPVGERIRTVLLDPATGDLDAVTELLLYQASRRRLVLERIAPALDAGRTVVCDRWHTATAVYQGIAGGVVPASSRRRRAATEDSTPALLDVPGGREGPNAPRPRPHGEKDAAFQAACASRRVFIARPVPRGRRLRDVDAVASDVWEAVRDLV
jgi:dTMP kinase